MRLNVLTAAERDISNALRPLAPPDRALALLVDGVPLDGRLADTCDRPGLVGLVPTLLDWMELPGEREVAWERVLPPVGEACIAPLLMYPGDPGISGAIVAEVEATHHTIHWHRFGFAVGDEGDFRDPTTPLGDVFWLVPSPTFSLERTTYEATLDQFRRKLATATTPASESERAHFLRGSKLPGTWNNWSTRPADLEAEVTLLPTDQGGSTEKKRTGDFLWHGFPHSTREAPRTLALSDYSQTREFVGGMHEYISDHVLLPGTTDLANVYFFDRRRMAGLFRVGMVIELNELDRPIGAPKVGFARITRIFNPQLLSSPRAEDL